MRMNESCHMCEGEWNGIKRLNKVVLRECVMARV